MNEYLNMNDDLWNLIYLNNNKINPKSLSGSVLYLGMGSSFIPRLQSDKVTKTTILEIDNDVISFNIKNNLIKKDWIIIEGDAYIFEPTELYDFIFIDIFYKTTTIEIMDNLIKKYTKYLKEDRVLDASTNIFYLKSVVKL